MDFTTSVMGSKNRRLEGELLRHSNQLAVLIPSGAGRVSITVCSCGPFKTMSISQTLEQSVFPNQRADIMSM